MSSLRLDRNVFQEPDDNRLLRRLTAVTAQDLPATAVRRLAAGDLTLVEQLPVASQQAVMALLKPRSQVGGELERMVGVSLDYVPVAFLELARWAARAVARIVDQDRKPIGTATLISPRLILTNHHVTPDTPSARRQLAQFDYELDVDGSVRATTEFALDPDAFSWTSGEDVLDATIVALGRRVSGSSEPNAFGFCPPSAASDKHAEGDFVTIVQHPEGDYKQIALRENRVLGRGKRGVTLYYGADTLPGSSGSPVFNDQFELVALHHAGGPRNDKAFENGTKIDADVNEGIRISAIVQTLRGVLDDLPAPQRRILAASLDPPSAGPHLLPPAPDDAGGGKSTAQSPSAIGPPRSAGNVGPSADGWAHTALPLELAVRVGTISADPSSPLQAMPLSAALEQNRPPDPNYVHRRGYDEGFLTIEALLPGLPATLLNAAAVPHKSQRTAAGVVLRYLHFSLVLNAQRRMPFFTAVNIDGSRSRSIDRSTGEVEASETWYVDTRIEPTEQLEQAMFERQRPRIFDRGHMVRRLDPAWGAAPTALRAADDTFHFANCCPQVSAFNQRATLWAGIENYVLNNAKADHERITVFTGPVFGDDDPEYRGVAVPKAFWKLLVRVEGGDLRCTGFLADQSELLTRALGAPESLEEWGDFGAIEVFKTPIRDIEKKTGLSFGDLTAHDTTSLETVGPAPLRSLDDVDW